MFNATPKTIASPTSSSSSSSPPISPECAPNTQNPFKIDGMQGAHSIEGGGRMSDSYIAIDQTAPPMMAAAALATEAIDADGYSAVSADNDAAHAVPAGNYAPRPQSLVKPVEPQPTMMTSYVADDLISKIKLASPTSGTSGAMAASIESDATAHASTSAVPRRFLQQSQAAAAHQIDVTVISDIECEAQYLATAVDTLTESLGGLLHSISSITADNVEVYRSSVTRLTDSMDANIKSMYTIMAKTEEIGTLMRPAEQLNTRIHEIKRLVDMLDMV